RHGRPSLLRAAGVACDRAPSALPPLGLAVSRRVPLAVPGPGGQDLDPQPLHLLVERRRRDAQAAGRPPLVPAGGTEGREDQLALVLVDEGLEVAAFPGGAGPDVAPRRVLAPAGHDRLCHLLPPIKKVDGAAGDDNGPARVCE